MQYFHRFGKNKMHMHIQVQIKSCHFDDSAYKLNVLILNLKLESYNVKTNGNMYANM